MSTANVKNSFNKVSIDGLKYGRFSEQLCAISSDYPEQEFNFPERSIGKIAYSITTEGNNLITSF